MWLKAKADEIFDTPENQQKIKDLQGRMRKFAATFKDRDGNSHTANNSDEFDTFMQDLDKTLVIS